MTERPRLWFTRRRIRRFTFLLSATLGFFAAGGAISIAGGSVGAGNQAAAPVVTSSVDGCDAYDDLRLQLQWVTQAQFAGYFAARDQGFYRERCLNVTFQDSFFGTNPLDTLVAVENEQVLADVAVAWAPKALAARLDGSPFLNVAQIFQESGTIQVSLKSSGIETVTDLVGTRVGTWGDGNDLELLAGLRRHGLDPATDLELVTQSFDVGPLLSGEIDSMQATTGNEYAQLLSTLHPDTGQRIQPSDLNVIYWADEEVGMLADGLWVDERRFMEPGFADKVQRFVTASLEGWLFCREDAEACLNSVMEAGPLLGRSHQSWQLIETLKLIWPSDSGIGIAPEFSWLRSGLILASDPDVDLGSGNLSSTMGSTTGTWTDDFVKAAHAELHPSWIDLTGYRWHYTHGQLNLAGD